MTACPACSVNEKAHGRGYCRPCVNAKNSGYYREVMQNPKRRAARMRRQQLTNRGLTPQEYSTLLEQQRGLCAICAKEPSGVGSRAQLHIDHDHATGKVRGLLCGECNASIGLMRDDIARLQAAIEYLKKAPNEI